MPEDRISPRPVHWPHRADPPGRYWGNYERYQRRGGMVRLEEDSAGLTRRKAAYGDMARFYFFSLAFDQLMKEGARGDIAELGTYEGETATVLAKMARRMNTTCWVLDTFEGFNAADLQGIDAARAMEFGNTSLEAVRAVVGEDDVRFIKGHFPESTSQMPGDLSFCLVHIDCDLYQPVRHALEYFYPRLLPGGYLIVHDYASLSWDGTERAVDEFFADKPEAVIPLTDGGGSAVIRKARHASDRLNAIDRLNWLARKRCALFSDQYADAANNALHDILDQGWSEGEPWGVWGVGPVHIMNLAMAHFPIDDLIVELDVAAAVLLARPSQEIGVWTGGKLLANLEFSEQNNRGRREVPIPFGAVTAGEWGVPTLRLEFRPSSVRPINELNPETQDSRPLGLALHGIRRVEKNWRDQLLTDQTEARLGPAFPTDQAEARLGPTFSTDQTEARLEPAFPTDRIEAKLEPTSPTDQTEARLEPISPADQAEATLEETSPTDQKAAPSIWSRLRFRR